MYRNKVSIVVPSYNPDEKLAEVLRGLCDFGFDDIIVVDDGSREDTKQYFAAARELPQCTLLTHEVNRGKGAALKTALAFFAKERPERVGMVTADGDGQHALEDIAACAEALCETPDTFIIGARDFSLPQVPARSKFGNKMTSFVFRTGVGMKLSDTQTGLRAIPASAAEIMSKVPGDRYEYETNALLALKKYRIPYREIPISTVYIEENATSHFRPVRDSIRIYANIIRYAASSLICAGVDELVFFLLTLAFRPEAGSWLLFGLTYAARAVSSALNYVINRRIVFGSGSKRSAVRYFALAVAQVTDSGFLVRWITSLASADLPVLQTLLKIAVDVILFFASYHIQRVWVFADKKSANTDNNSRS